jgi:hypothetical protein
MNQSVPGGQMYVTLNSDDSETPLTGRVLAWEDEKALLVAWGPEANGNNPFERAVVEYMDELRPVRKDDGRFPGDVPWQCPKCLCLFERTGYNHAPCWPQPAATPEPDAKLWGPAVTRHCGYCRTDQPVADTIRSALAGSGWMCIDYGACEERADAKGLSDTTAGLFGQPE